MAATLDMQPPAPPRTSNDNDFDRMLNDEDEDILINEISPETIEQHGSPNEHDEFENANRDNAGDHHQEESDEHLPRVQVELDKLNYANESINSLELELEESKREYLQTMQDSEDELTALEKKLGACVDKSKPYYDARIELNDAKEKYLKAKIRFETAQELYVAAKRMQMYAEENLETSRMESTLTNASSSSSGGGDPFTAETPAASTSISNNDEDSKNKEVDLNLRKIFDIAKIKVNETELAKQSSDLEQIEAFRLYEEKRSRCEELEKSLKKQIEKSRKYFELKATFYKELRFLFTKIEGLKSCLKEAKFTYQQSLKNLELISTEIHTQRQTATKKSTDIGSSEDDHAAASSNNKNAKNHQLTSSSSSTLSSSSSSISFENNNKQQQQHQTSSLATAADAAAVVDTGSTNSPIENEDFDEYFKTDLKNEIKPATSRNNSEKIHTAGGAGASAAISDEEIENLKLDEKFKKYKLDLSNGNNRYFGDNGVAPSASVITSSSPPLTTNNNNGDNGETKSVEETPVVLAATSRPQFRVPFFLSKK